MTEEQIAVSMWLDRAHDADDEVKALESVYKTTRSIAERCTAIYDSVGGSGGSHSNSQESVIHQLCDDGEKIKLELEELRQIRAEIQDTIHSIRDSKCETVLNMRYLGYMKMHQIANELGIDRKTVNRRHLKALDLVYMEHKSTFEGMINKSTAE